MGAKGTTTVDFGAHPGATEASATVTGQGTIASDSLAEAWLFPVATADHSVDEHIVDGPLVFATSVTAGVGFTIRALTRNGQNLTGSFSVGWVWD